MRKWAFRINPKRALVIILTAMVAFIFALLLLSPVVAGVERVFVCNKIESMDGTYMCGKYRELGYPTSQALQKAIEQELRKRMLVPAFLQKPCYSPNLSLCQFIEERRVSEEYVDLLLLGAAMIGLMASIAAWRSTRPDAYYPTGEEW
jgi:hypothetical protein